MRWPWHHEKGDAEQAIRDADEQHAEAKQQTPKVDRAARTARELTKRADRFAREVERSWRPKESP